MLAHKAFDLGPQAGIAFALHVARSEDPLKPGCPGTLHRFFLVIETVIAQNLSLRIVCGRNRCAAMDQAMRLIKVRRLGDVVGDDLVVLPGLFDAIDLYREQDGDFCTIQFAGQQDHGGSSPTVAEENDVGVRLFLIAKDAVVIAVQQAQNAFEGSFSMPVFKDLD